MVVDPVALCRFSDIVSFIDFEIIINLPEFMLPAIKLFFIIVEFAGDTVWEGYNEYEKY